MTLSPAALALARGDIDALLALHRDTFGSARMDDGDDGEGDDGAGGTGGTGGGATGTVTQEQATAAATRAAAEARRKAIKDVAETLGMSVDEAKTFIADKQAADEQAKSEEQKRADALAERERKAEERERETAQRERNAAIREALAEAGATGQELKDAAVLIAADLAADADDDAIKTAVDDLKKRREELFKGTGGGTAGTGTDTGTAGGTGTGGGNGSGGKGGSPKLAAGEERARELGLVREPEKASA